MPTEIKGPHTIQPNESIVIKAFIPPDTRAVCNGFDVMVWLDPQTERNVASNIRHDITQRGYTEDQVRAEIEQRQPDIRAHTAPQAECAGLRVRYSRPPTRSAHPDNARLDRAGVMA